MRVAIASGKGGTGKTTVAVNLAHVLAQEEPVQFIDCDVEEPNAHFFPKPSLIRAGSPNPGPGSGPRALHWLRRMCKSLRL